MIRHGVHRRESLFSKTERALGSVSPEVETVRSEIVRWLSRRYSLVSSIFNKSSCSTSPIIRYLFLLIFSNLALTGGAAEKTAALTAGDQLLEVNGIDVTRMARIEAWSLMKKLSDGEANLLVRHPATKSS